MSNFLCICIYKMFYSHYVLLYALLMNVLPFANVIFYMIQLHCVYCVYMNCLSEICSENEY